MAAWESEPAADLPALRRAGLIGLAVAGLILVLRAAAFFASGSLAVLADTIDPLLNLAAAAATLAGVSLSRRPPDPRRPYGYRKLEFVTVGAHGALAAAGAGVVAFAAWRQLASRAPLHASGLTLALFALSVAAAWRQSHLMAAAGARHASPALKSAAHQAYLDVLVGLAVLLNLVVIGVSGWWVLDLCFSLAVVAAIVGRAIGLLRASVLGLLDAAPPEARARAAAALEHQLGPVLVGYHDLRCRDAGGQTFADFHLQFAADTSLETAHDLAERAEAAVQAALGRADAMAHIETYEQIRPDRGHRRPESSDRERSRRRAALVSLGTAIVLAAVKFVAAALTGSAAVLSDALESLVNIAAAIFALYSIRLARSGSDDVHQYGHHKVEFLAAGFEGMLIALAATLIVLTAVPRLRHPQTPGHLDWGVALVALTAAANAVLGAYLKRAGRRLGSLTLEADGQHVMSDVWSTLGAIGGLAVVQFAGWTPADPLVALAVALWLGWTALGLGRRALHGVIDTVGPETYETAAGVLEAAKGRGVVIGWHKLRIRDAGGRRFIECHLQFVEGATLDRAHAVSEEVEAALAQALRPAEAIIHAEPASDLR
jgi:cation diffusion facilitator family transporter